MRIDKFELMVNNHAHTNEGYVEMYHGEQYSVRLSSNSTRRSDVVLEIDGLEVGIWRLEPYSTIVIERGVEDRGIFTFFTVGSQEAMATGLWNLPADKLGLVKATFKPELVRPVATGRMPMSIIKGMQFNSSLESMCCTRSGGTGLTGHSRQEFGSTTALNHDPNAIVEIHLRLVLTQGNPVRPKVGINPRSNPVPPPVR